MTPKKQRYVDILNERRRLDKDHDQTAGPLFEARAALTELMGAKFVVALTNYLEAREAYKDGDIRIPHVHQEKE